MKGLWFLLCWPPGCESIWHTVGKCGRGEVLTLRVGGLSCAGVRRGTGALKICSQLWRASLDPVRSPGGNSETQPTHVPPSSPVLPTNFIPDSSARVKPEVSIGRNGAPLLNSSKNFELENKKMYNVLSSFHEPSDSLILTDLLIFRAQRIWYRCLMCCPAAYGDFSVGHWMATTFCELGPPCCAG